jgi:hypothetical protein
LNTENDRYPSQQAAHFSESINWSKTSLTAKYHDARMTLVVHIQLSALFASRFAVYQVHNSSDKLQLLPQQLNKIRLIVSKKQFNSHADCNKYC